MANDMKRSLAQAYFEVIDQGRTKAMTVTSVCEQAGVSRVTFYYHFADIYDLVEWIYRDYFSSKLDSLVSSESPWLSLGSAIACLLKDERYDVRKNALHLDRSNLIGIFERVLGDFIAACLDTEPEASSLDEDDRTFLLKVLTYSASGIMLRLVNEEGSAFGLDDTMQRFEDLVRSQIHIYASA